MMFLYALYNLLLYTSDVLVALCMASLEKMNKTKRGINERRGDKPQAQDNQSKLIQAGKTLEERDRVLVAAIRRSHIELAKKRKSLSEIEASKDTVEAAWNEFNHANARYCARAGWGPPFEKDKQPEEPRRRSTWNPPPRRTARMSCTTRTSMRKSMPTLKATGARYMSSPPP